MDDMIAFDVFREKSVMYISSLLLCMVVCCRLAVVAL